MVKTAKVRKINRKLTRRGSSVVENEQRIIDGGDGSHRVVIAYVDAGYDVWPELHLPGGTGWVEMGKVDGLHARVLNEGEAQDYADGLVGLWKKAQERDAVLIAERTTQSEVEAEVEAANQKYNFGFADVVVSDFADVVVSDDDDDDELTHCTNCHKTPENGEEALRWRTCLVCRRAYCAVCCRVSGISSACTMCHNALEDPMNDASGLTDSGDDEQNEGKQVFEVPGRSDLRIVIEHVLGEADHWTLKMEGRLPDGTWVSEPVWTAVRTQAEAERRAEEWAKAAARGLTDSSGPGFPGPCVGCKPSYELLEERLRVAKRDLATMKVQQMAGIIVPVLVETDFGGDKVLEELSSAVKSAMGDADDAATAGAEEADDDDAAIVGLGEALEKYGAHLTTCPAAREIAPCYCGWANIVKHFAADAVAEAPPADAPKTDAPPKS